ncbi:MAG: sugar kinase [Chloroflexi bacterium]|nr:sugar kinase [Chloroflexota bacterium]
MTNVVSLGIHILDILGRPVTHIPPGQNLAMLHEIRITVAGTAAGTSVDLAKLGAHVIAMGALGQDEIGNIVIDTMRRYGIDTTNLVRKPGVQTSATMLPIRPNGERPALHVTGANAELCYEDLNLDAIPAAQFLHYGGASLLPQLDGVPASRVLQFAKQHGLVTTMDMLGIERPDMLERIEPCLPFVDYFMPNIDEARMVCKLNDRKDMIKFFLDRGAGATIFKMGAEGSSIGTRDGETRIPAYRIDLVDTTGCGDGYCAGFITGLSMGWCAEEAARLGAAAGSLVATGLGSDAGIKNLDQTLEFMRTAETLPMTA